MSTFDDEISADSYFMRRLALARRAQDLPASVQFDLARSPIPDEQLDQVLTEFGVQMGNGWGIADIAHRLLTGTPDEKAVGDIKSLQQNLKLQGYLPSAYSPTGVWDNQSYYALRQADREAEESQRAGRGLLSAPVATGMRLITATLPSRVWQGVVGTAKGLVAQGQETAERVGLVGGVAGGAAIGAGIGSVFPGPGTLIGAAAGGFLGGAVGFFSDLFGEEPDEGGDQTGWENILDALQPFNEYSQDRTGVHQFFEDLSFVGSAASMAAGVGLAARGVTGAVTGARALQAARAAETVVTNPAELATLSQAGLPTAGLAATQPAPALTFARALTTPTQATTPSMLGAALRNPVPTGAVLGGFAALGDPNAGIGDVLEGAAFGAAGGLAFRAMGMIRFKPDSGPWIQSLRGIVDAHNVMSRPIFKLANGLYTGMTAGQIGARLVSGELVTPEVDPVTGKPRPAPTEIAKQIRQTQPLTSGMEIPFLGDLVDVASFVLYPTQLLPVKARQLASSMDGLMGEAGLRPWAHVAQVNGKLSMRQAVNSMREVFIEKPLMFTKLHLDGAVEMGAIAKLNESGVDEVSNAISFRRAVTELRRQIKSEARANGGRSETAEKLLREFSSSAEMVEAWAIHRLSGEGPLDQSIRNYMDVEEKLISWTADARRMGTLVDEAADGTPFLVAGPGGSFRYVTPTVVPAGYVQENVSQFHLTRLKRDLAAQKDKLNRIESGIGRELNPETRMVLHREREMATRDIQQTEATINAMTEAATKRKRLGDETNVVPAKLDTLTRRDIFLRKGEFNKVHSEYLEQLQRNKKLRETIPDEEMRTSLSAEGEVRSRYEFEVEKMSGDGLLTPRQRDELLRKPESKRLIKQINNHLEGQALVAARDIDVGPDLTKYLGDRGYKAVVTGDEVFLTPQIDSLVEQMKVPQYRRLRSFVETIGAGVKDVKSADLANISYRNMQASVEQALKRGPTGDGAHPIPLTGAQALRRLQSYLEKHNAKSVSTTPILGPVETAVRFKPDIRRLTPGDIETALGMVSGIDSRMANEVYKALKRGSAFGEDIRFMHPVLAGRQLGRAIRVSGLPGASQVIRGWHAESVPMGTIKGDVLRKDLTYSPPADLAASAQRGRVITEFRVTGVQAGLSKREIREGERLFDIVAETAVRFHPERYRTVDDFYKTITVDYRDKYAQMGNELFQLKWDSPSPTAKRLDKLTLSAPPEAKDWWTVSGHQIAEMFDGGVTVVGTGSKARKVSDAFLFPQIVGATSYNAGPKANITFAMKQLEAFKSGAPLPGQLPASLDVLEQLRAGNTMDRWGPELIKKHNVAYGKYQNLTGNLDYLTYDTVMQQAYGGINKAKAEPLIQDVADRLGWHIGEVQAAQWVAFKEETARFLEGEAAAALKRGDLDEAAKLRRKITQARDATNYQDALLRDATMEKYREIYGESLFNRTLHQVEESVRGSITFGPDYQYVIRLYSTGGFDTLVHENGHLLRRLLPEEEVQTIERAYGLRREVGPLDASPEIRRIAEQYHRESGIPLETDLLDQYATVDPERAKRIADAFEKQHPSPRDPATREAYEVFAQETVAQYHVLRKNGIEMIPWAGKGQPYKNAEDFVRDVRENKRLYYFKTLQDDAFGKGKITEEQMANNPLLRDSGIVVKDSAGNEYRQTYNDIFRAVHDIMAHAKEGVQTGPRGEENAWRAHAAMYSEKARRAMTTETRGQNSWVNFGPHLRQEGGKIPEKGEPGYVPLSERPFSEQKVMLLPEEYSQIENVRWTREAEERFADDITKYMYGQYKGNQATLFGQVRAAMATLWARSRDGLTDSASVPFGMRRHFDDLFRPDIEKLGIRRAGSSLRSKQVIGGAVIGGAQGALAGDQGFEDTLRGALFGAGVGLGVRKGLQKTYGYLPDALANLNTMLRYTLSFTFDLGRFTEQNSIAYMKHKLPMFLKPQKHVMKNEWRSPYRDGIVTGEQAWVDANRFYDELNGTNYFSHMVEWEQRYFQRGMLGFAPREFEAVQAFQMYQRGWSKEKIYEEVALLGRYGTAQTNLERSVNFVFFPFSFSKKLLSTLGDFIFQTPGRNLLIHEGLRRYHDSLVDDEFHSLIEDRLPLLEQLWMVNNLAFGASLGRFAWEGLADRRTDVGRAAQVLSSVFIPSGAATPLQQAFGALGDLSMTAFTPVVLTGESISRAGGLDGVDDILRRYIPMVREIERWAQTLNDQKTVVLSPQHLTPWSQFREYMEGVDAAEQEIMPMAELMGYTTVDGFLNSDLGFMWANDFDAEKRRLQEEYKQGWELTTQFENQEAIDAAALMDLAKKPNKSDAEEAFLQLIQNQETMQTMSDWMPEVLANQMEADSIRAFALRWVHDDRFAELYDRFMARTYGPIRRIA